MVKQKVSIQEGQRGIDKLSAYWQQLRGTRTMPTESEIEATELESVWDNCFLIRVDIGKSNYLYSYLGHTLLEALGYDAEEDEVLEKLVDPHSTQIIAMCDEVIRTGKPVVREDRFINRRNVEIRYRGGLVPLAGKFPDEISYILGTMDWKGY